MVKQTIGLPEEMYVLVVFNEMRLDNFPYFLLFDPVRTVLLNDMYVKSYVGDLNLNCIQFELVIYFCFFFRNVRVVTIYQQFVFISFSIVGFNIN